MKIILLNGPPRSGKTTSAKLLQFIFDAPVLVWGFSYHLKRYVHGIYLGQQGWNADPDIFDDVKSVPQDILNGKSWREMYIHYAENVIKPLHGKQWFGKMFLHCVEEFESNYKIIGVPDSGFVEEAVPVINKYGCDNIKLIRLYRNGTNFASDTRSYIDLREYGLDIIYVENNNTLEGLRINLSNHLHDFIA